MLLLHKDFCLNLEFFLAARKQHCAKTLLCLTMWESRWKQRWLVSFDDKWYTWAFTSTLVAVSPRFSLSVSEVEPGNELAWFGFTIQRISNHAMCPPRLLFCVPNPILVLLFCILSDRLEWASGMFIYLHPTFPYNLLGLFMIKLKRVKKRRS